MLSPLHQKWHKEYKFPLPLPMPHKKLEELLTDLLASSTGSFDSFSTKGDHRKI